MAVRAAVLGAVLAVSASPALALSCMQPQVERSFNAWVDSEDTYYIGVGSITPLDPLPKTKGLIEPDGGFGKKEPVTARYLFSGELLDGERGHPYEMPITVSVSCIGPWCGHFPKKGTRGLMGLRGVGIQNLTLDIHACPGSVFPVDREETVSACMRAGRCAESERQ